MEVIVVDDNRASFGGWVVIAVLVLVAIPMFPVWLVSQVTFLIYEFMFLRAAKTKFL